MRDRQSRAHAPILSDSPRCRKIERLVGGAEGILNRRPLRFTLMLNSTSTTTRLNGGKVLGSSGYLASAELYVGLVSKTQTSSAVLADR